MQVLQLGYRLGSFFLFYALYYFPTFFGKPIYFRHQKGVRVAFRWSSGSERPRVLC